jgi:hypothetical protein
LNTEIRAADREHKQHTVDAAEEIAAYYAGCPTGTPDIGNTRLAAIPLNGSGLVTQCIFRIDARRLHRPVRSVPIIWPVDWSEFIERASTALYVPDSFSGAQLRAHRRQLESDPHERVVAVAEK